MNDPEANLSTNPDPWDGPTKPMTHAELETKVCHLETEVEALKKDRARLERKVDECISDARKAIQLMREAMASFSAAMPKLEIGRAHV